jgi:hypothetical protein
MALITLSEVKKLGYDDLSAGLAETIVTVNPLYALLPFNTVAGNAYAFNRELTLGGVIAGTRGQATTNAKTAATFTQVAQALITLIGDAEIAGQDIAQGVGEGAGNDPVAIQVALKAKAIGREFQRLMVAGDSASPAASNDTGVTNSAEFDGLVKLIGSDATFAAQKLDQANAVLTLDMLDTLLHTVVAGDAQFIMTSGAGVRKIRSLLRALGGVTTIEVAGKHVDAFNGVPIFRNDFMLTDYVGGTAGNQTHIIAGMFDDGSRKMGISGVIPTAGGLLVDDVGYAEGSDMMIKRVKMYATMAVHSVKSVAGLWNVGV